MTKQIPEEDIFCFNEEAKLEEKIFLKSDDGLLIHKLNTMANSTSLAGYNHTS